MSEKLNKEDISIILESFKYSKLNIDSSSDSPPEIRKENRERIEAIEKKLRKIRDEIED